MCSAFTFLMKTVLILFQFFVDKAHSCYVRRETHESTLSKQREDLQDWERKLCESEERLGDRQRILNEREKRTNEMDKIYKQKEKDLEDMQKMIDEATKTLKEKEDDISCRLSKLAIREKASPFLLLDIY